MTKCEYAPCNKDCVHWNKCQNKKLRKKHEPTGLDTSDYRTYKREWMRRDRERKRSALHVASAQEKRPAF